MRSSRVHYYSMPVGHASTMLRRDSVSKSHVAPVDHWSWSAAWDYDFYVRLAPHVRFANIPYVLYYYRRHPEQVGTKGVDIQLKTALEIAMRHLSSFNIHTSTEIIEIFTRFYATSLRRINKSQWKEIQRLGEEIANINDFYGYRGVSSDFINHLNRIVGIYSAYNSSSMLKKYVVITHRKALSIPVIYRALARIKRLANRYHIDRFATRLAKHARRLILGRLGSYSNT